MAAPATRWSFTAKQLENTPSRRAGIDAEKELSYRQVAANFIQDMGQKLSVSQLTINTAIVFMHRFYMFHSFTRFNKTSIGTACLFLAAKVEEQPRKLEHLIRCAHSCQHPGSAPLDVKKEPYMEAAQELVVNENILLQTLGFNLQVEHPHSYVVKTTQLVRASKELSQASYFLATNSLHLTTMCLQYPPAYVACVCIHVACKWSNFEIPRSSEGKEWFQYMDKDITAEMLDRLTRDFLNILEKCPSKLKRKIMTWKKDEIDTGPARRPKHEASAAAGSANQLTGPRMADPSRVKAEPRGAEREHRGPDGYHVPSGHPSASGSGDKHRPPAGYHHRENAVAGRYDPARVKVEGSRPDHHAVKRDSDYHIKRELAYHDGKREPGHHDMKRDPGYHDVKREPGHHERREPGYHERPGRESGGGGAHPAGRGEYGLHQVKLENPAKRHPHALGAQEAGMRRIKTEPNLSLQEYQERKALQAQQQRNARPAESSARPGDPFKAPGAVLGDRHAERERHLPGGGDRFSGDRHPADRHPGSERHPGHSMGERHPGAERHPAGGERHHAADPQARLKERHLPPPAHSAHAAGSSEPHRKELNRQRPPPLPPAGDKPSGGEQKKLTSPPPVNPRAQSQMMSLVERELQRQHTLRGGSSQQVAEAFRSQSEQKARLAGKGAGDVKAETLTAGDAHKVKARPDDKPVESQRPRGLPPDLPQLKPPGRSRTSSQTSGPEPPVSPTTARLRRNERRLSQDAVISLKPPQHREEAGDAVGSQSPPAGGAPPRGEAVPEDAGLRAPPRAVEESMRVPPPAPAPFGDIMAFCEQAASGGASPVLPSPTKPGVPHSIKMKLPARTQSKTNIKESNGGMSTEGAVAKHSSLKDERLSASGGLLPREAALESGAVHSRKDRSAREKPTKEVPPPLLPAQTVAAPPVNKVEKPEKSDLKLKISLGGHSGSPSVRDGGGRPDDVKRQSSHTASPSSLSASGDGLKLKIKLNSNADLGSGGTPPAPPATSHPPVPAQPKSLKMVLKLPPGTTPSPPTSDSGHHHHHHKHKKHNKEKKHKHKDKDRERHREEKHSRKRPHSPGGDAERHAHSGRHGHHKMARTDSTASLSNSGGGAHGNGRVGADLSGSARNSPASLQQVQNSIALLGMAINKLQGQPGVPPLPPEYHPAPPPPLPSDAPPLPPGPPPPQH